MNGIFLFFLIFGVIVRIVGVYRSDKYRLYRAYTNACHPPVLSATDIYFKGTHSGISKEDIHTILIKRFAYYRALSEDNQLLFRKRLYRFMNDKIFIIKDDTGYREMPVLVSAAAIQLTFGLKEYQFSFYRYIRIYPQAYYAEDAFLKVLAGNVQENTISIAWDHLLEGYEQVADGSNVGLHEMSHALYFQKMVIEEEYATSFKQEYIYLTEVCKAAYTAETKGIKNLYSDYADLNLQEFWAETTELFFEKPAALEKEYPLVFKAMKQLLNQYPQQGEHPPVENNLSLTEKIENWCRLI